MTQVFAAWKDDDYYIGTPRTQDHCDAPTRGALPETEEKPVPGWAYIQQHDVYHGPAPRDIAPGSTDKWYMVTPVDTAGRRADLPAGGQQHLSVVTATVAVKEGQLTVTYKTLKGVTVHSEYLAIYPDLETAVKNAADLGGVSFAA